MKTHASPSCFVTQCLRNMVSCLFVVSLVYMAIVQFIFNETRLEFFHWAVIVSLAYTVIRGFILYHHSHKHT